MEKDKKVTATSSTCSSTGKEPAKKTESDNEMNTRRIAEKYALDKAEMSNKNGNDNENSNDAMSSRIADKYALDVDAASKARSSHSHSHTASTNPLGDLSHSQSTTLTPFDDLQPLPTTSSSSRSDARPGAFHVGPFRVPNFMRRASLRAGEVPQDLEDPQEEVNLSAELVTPDLEATTAPLDMDLSTGTRLDGSDPGGASISTFQADFDLSTEVVEGKVLPDRKVNASTNHRFGWLAMVLLFVAVIAAVIVLVLQPWKSDQTDPSAAPTEPPTVANPQATTLFSQDLSLAVATAIQEDTTHPFYKANQWVLEDPNLDTYSPERKMTRFYLAVLYYATNGPTWLRSDHWMSYSVSECEWYSSSTYSQGSPYYIPDICDETGALMSLSLAFNNLTGTMPIWYTQFIPNLKVADYGHNHIGGHLPVVQSTPHIQVMILSQNPFTGVPAMDGGAFFESIKVLKVDGLHFSRSHMSGGLMKIMPNLEVMNFTSVHGYDGPLYAHMGELPHLQYVGYGHTEAQGTIPTEWASATALRELDLSSLPDLYGSIPSQLGTLTQLTKLDLSNTPGISGTVPTELCQMVEREQLELDAVCGDRLQCCT